MNYDLNPGSGWGDIYMYVPTSLFTGKSGYFTLYSEFEGANDGFEEWAAMTSNPPPVPEPGTFLLLGTGFLGLAVFSKRRRNNAA
ncbi:PEP-CTERM sorting domain-containing protein [Geomonas oryzisoli]|uniref:PEP-CTERM sorting domain-containing protein n=2 Tax=Geomonas oryzisoli TaxID=2847992 RepID=A0ABX8JBK2_9BACT|nr:PEP-CTERM sorting domain-containing protein [Geomonas oryzisoli]